MHNAFSELNHFVEDISKHISASASSVLVMQNNQIVNEFYSGNHDKSSNSRVIDEESQFNVAVVFVEQAVSIDTPSQLDETLPRNGFFWWVKDKTRPLSELGNAVLVIPEHNVVAVQMVNQLESNPPEYDYIKDIQKFGNLVLKCILSNSFDV